MAAAETSSPHSDIETVLNTCLKMDDTASTSQNLLKEVHLQQKTTSWSTWVLRVFLAIVFINQIKIMNNQEELSKALQKLQQGQAQAMSPQCSLMDAFWPLSVLTDSRLTAKAQAQSGRPQSGRPVQGKAR
ncbi:hypothetical protein CBOM_00542 [Ceraceosorus bombacis]|uniref:Uncharacterized protein n=1 Tax=Ceraceosorus bombacis TaxID=401625 RepID=A0A0P1BA64_9BASI|nr:hypothetical protein CBOM_00542 [Ceraceosorus bombacis]